MPDDRQPAEISTFRLRRRTPGSFLLVPCPKQGRSIRCQGQLEAAAATILVSCPAVAQIQEQPLSIWYKWHQEGDDLQIELLENRAGVRPRNDKTAGVSYIVPDFLVDMAQGNKRLLEIKPSDRLDRPVVHRKLAVARIFAEHRGWTFHVITEKELGREPLLDNLKLIRRYRLAQTDDILLQRLESLVPQDGQPLGDLARQFETADTLTVRMHLFHLLATDRLSFDPQSAPLNDQTLIYPQGVITWDPFASVWAPSGCWTGGPGVWSANRPPTATSPKTPSSS